MYDLSQLESGQSGTFGDNVEIQTKPSWADVPWRTIVGAVSVTLLTIIAVFLTLASVRIITWIAIAGFFAIVLAPPVGRVQRHVGNRRTLATGIVVFAALAIIVGIVTLFVMPVRTQLIATITDLPGTVHQAAQGRGPVGNIVTKLHIESYVKSNEAQLTRTAQRLDNNSFETAQTVLGLALAFVTITLITFFMLAQAESIGRAATNLIPQRRRASMKRGAADAASAVSGYVIGNLLVSLIAGVAAFILLAIMGVPSPVVLALFVAVADLVPMVGATIGAAVSVIAAYLHTPAAGLAAVIFFVIYQQIENSAIYPWIMSRKVKVNPLIVLLSVLLGVEVWGMLGALLAVPLSGAIQVIIKAVRQEHQRDQLVLPDNLTATLDL